MNIVCVSPASWDYPIWTKPPAYYLVLNQSWVVLIKEVDFEY